MPRVDKTLVIFPGWGIDVAVFQGFSARLASRYQVKLMNYTDYCARFDDSIERVAQRIAAVIPDESIVLGWSLGGLFGATLASLYPHKVMQLITLCTNPLFIKNHDWPGIEKNDFEEFTQLLNNNASNCLYRFAVLMCKATSVDLQAVRKFKHYLLMRTSNHYLQATLQWLSQDFRELFKKINCPQWHFFSKNDAIVPMEVSERLATVLPHARIDSIEKGALHHAPFIHDAGILLSLVERV